jgi:hypothetical protein|tara:strand:+ start:83 stop:502 length:420 start_codon:yes stop_codon:yes gene_type:complete
MKSCVVEDKIGAFVEAVTASERFDLLGTSIEDSEFVLRDTSLSEGVDGAYVEVSVEEVIEKPLNDILIVLNVERKPIVLQGITRIVGYYSRINNWNKSKVGELRDRIISRADGGYGFGKKAESLKDVNMDDALVAVNSL